LEPTAAAELIAWATLTVTGGGVPPPPPLGGGVVVSPPPPPPPQPLKATTSAANIAALERTKSFLIPDSIKTRGPQIKEACVRLSWLAFIRARASASDPVTSLSCALLPGIRSSRT
jgi:hypothetical protein